MRDDSTVDVIAPMASFKQLCALSCALVAIVAACSSSGGSSPAAGPSTCSTGTEVVLVKPVPGTSISDRTKGLKIASSGAIAYPNTALLAVATNGSSSGPFPIVGPVKPPRDTEPAPKPPPTPTPQPTAPIPFPSPIFYAAHGFKLGPGATYYVEVVRTHVDCHPYRIRNARFSTRHN